MPVMTAKRIYRADLQNNPHVFYLFGDNDMREGLGGQAAEMRGEDNAIGVRTKWAPSMSPDAFFSDDEYETICDMIDMDLDPAFEAVMNGAIVVIPADGLGTGLSKLAEKAPRVLSYLEERLEDLRNAG